MTCHPVHALSAPSAGSIITQNSRRRRYFDQLRGLYTRFFVEWWTFEVICMTISISMIGAIFIILLAFDGEQATISNLDALVSNLCAIAKWALLLSTVEALGQLKWSWFKDNPRKLVDFEIFDVATKSAWGSVRLMIRTRCMSLSSLGALIVVLSISFDMWIQQTIIYTNLWFASNESTQTARAISYQPSYPVDVANNTVSLFESDLMYANVLLPYLSVLKTTPALPTDCPNSNCTWDAFDSLGICASCQDVSSSLHWACMETALDWSATADVKASNTTACGFFLRMADNGTVLVSGYAQNPLTNESTQLLQLRSLPLSIQDLDRANLEDPLTIENDTRPIAKFVITAMPSGLGGIVTNSTPVSQECAMSWCKEYKQITSSFGNTTNVILDTSPLPLDHDDLLDSAPFYVSSNATVHLRGMVNQVFSFSSTFDTTTSASKTSFLGTQQGTEPDWRQWLYNNVPDLVAGLAVEMTEYLQTEFSGVEPVNGTVWNSSVFVETRLEWMVFPAVVTLLGLVFLVATIRKSARDAPAIGIWKTSILAVLQNGLGDDIQKDLDAQDGLGNVRTRAKNIHTRLI